MAQSRLPLTALAWGLSTVLHAAPAAVPARPSTMPTAAAASAAPVAAPAKPAPRPEQLPPVAGEALAHTCAACHGTLGRLGDEAFMPLAGMPAAEFVTTMQAFRSGDRPATLMGHVARGLTDADLRSMADFFARQVPAAGSAADLAKPVRPGKTP